MGSVRLKVKPTQMQQETLNPKPPPEGIRPSPAVLSPSDRVRRTFGQIAEPEAIARSWATKEWAPQNLDARSLSHAMS